MGQTGSILCRTGCRHKYAVLRRSSRAECINMGSASCRWNPGASRFVRRLAACDLAKGLRGVLCGTSIGPFAPRLRKPVSTTVHHKAAQWGESIVGPLGGHHHESYAVRTSRDSGSGTGGSWVKLRSPHLGVLRYDQRCFLSEEELLTFLSGRVSRIPRVIDPDPAVPVHSFIEGRTLGAVAGDSGPVDVLYVDQIVETFGALIRIDAREISIARACGGSHRRSRWDDSASFYRGLLRFADTSAYKSEIASLRVLFDRLGVSRKLLGGLKKRASMLTDRPFTLVHGDLHRENFIVDDAKNLWTIDWELARIGDPLYELATHLHLMGYPEEQEAEVVARWRNAVEAVRKDATRGAEDDLAHYMAFKRVQSVHTDVMRAGLQLALLHDDCPEAGRTASDAANVVAGALKAVEGIGPGTGRATPSVGEVEAVLMSWRQDFGRTAAAQHQAMVRKGVGRPHADHGHGAFRHAWGRLGTWIESRWEKRRDAALRGGSEPVAVEGDAAPAPLLLG
ncbi:phosphotransferase [Streptomyces sp. NPDC088733]|uniref:phosphotransferase n=1 Tax=Streptomyces sp. NPDC088733 TaxID=3365880 RepID=UPI0038186462